MATLFPSSVVAVISAFPSFTPVITPEFTVAMLSSELSHFTFLFVASVGATVAFIVSVFPFSIVNSSLSNVPPVTGTGISSFSTVVKNLSDSLSKYNIDLDMLYNILMKNARLSYKYFKILQRLKKN